MSLIAESPISSIASEEPEEQWPSSCCCSSRVRPKEKLFAEICSQLTDIAAEQEGGNLPLIHNLMQIIHMVLLKS